MSRNGSITYQIKQELLSKCKFGESRDLAKKNGIAKYYIYSYGTLNTYMKQLNYMVKWARENNIKLKSIDDIKINGDRWLQYCIDSGMSPWTLTTRRAALSKLCGVPYSYFKTEIPKRTRASVTRSRDMSKSLSRFSEEQNKELVTLCKCSGLRRRELEALRGDQLVYINGKPHLHIYKGCKGGRARTIELCGTNDEIELCVIILNKAGNKHAFDTIPKNVNIHGYRSMYAKRLYSKYARPISTIPKNEILYCRKDKKGIRYDKKALQQVSMNLGHTRIEISNLSYLY